jgi:hypothetical protein
MAKKKSMKGKGTYNTYAQEGRFVKNLRAKLERHLRKHPTDEQAKKALAQVGKVDYRRKPSHTKGNYPDQIIRVRDAAGHVIIATQGGVKL